MNNIENKALRQESGKTENIGEAAKRIAAVVLSVGIMLGVSGCSTNGNANVSNADVSSSISCDSQNLEEEWKEAKKEVKQQIIEWYSINIASPETIRRLYHPEFAEENSLNFSFCKICENHLPKYGVYRSLVEIPGVINHFFEELDKIDTSNFSDESEIQNTIDTLLEQCKININNGEITFDNIPTIENETEESKDKIYVVTNGDLAYFVKNGNKFEGENTYTLYIFVGGTNSAANCVNDEWWKNICSLNSETPYDIITTTTWFDDVFVKFTANGEEVELERIEVEDILKNLSVMFGNNPEFKELCEEAGVSVNA